MALVLASSFLVLRASFFILFLHLSGFCFVFPIFFVPLQKLKRHSAICKQAIMIKQAIMMSVRAYARNH